MDQFAVEKTFAKDTTPFSAPKGTEDRTLTWSKERAFKRVLLVFPDYKGGHFGALRPPAGLGYLAQILEDNFIDYDVIDMSVGGNEDTLIEKLDSFNPDLVGISMMSFMYHRSYEILRLVKEKHPGVTTIGGGPHLSCVRETVLRECDAMDFGAVKEGEATLMDLVNGKPPSEIGGLIWRDGNRIVFNGERPYERMLDVYPWPKYSKFPLGSYVTEEIGIESSRGCPQQCTFCPVIPSIGRKLRQRTADSVVEEIQHWYDKGVRQVSFLDDNFSIIRDHTLKVCDAVESQNFSGLELNCNNGIRADRVDQEMLDRMYDAGFRYLAFGVEGGNDRVLQNIKKGESIQDIEDAIKMALKAKLNVTLFFIVGNTGETARDVDDSIELALRYPVFDTRFYNMIPFPGSEFYDWVTQSGLFIKNPENYLNSSSQWDFEPVFETEEFSKAERIKCLHLVRKVRRTVRYKAMKREIGHFGIFAPIVARLYVNDKFQDLLMKNRFLRTNLKRLYMRFTSTGGNAVSLATMRGD